MYENILIPIFVDDHEGLDRASRAAKLLLSEGGKITLLNIIEEIPSYAEAYVPAEILKGGLDDVRHKLDEMAKSVGSDVEARVVKGHAGRTILDEARSMKSDLIIVSSHRPEFADYFLGSAASRVVRHAHSPVLVLR